MLKPPRGTQLNRSHPLARGLVGCWLMNEGNGSKIYDSSGNRKDSIGFTGTAGWTPGKFGSALILDGNSDYVEIINNACASLVSGTIEFWFKSSLLPISTKESFLWNTKEGADNQSIISFEVYYPSGLSPRLFFLVKPTTTNALAFYGSTTLLVNTWYHAVVTISPAGNFLYLNSQLETLTYIAGDSTVHSFFSTLPLTQRNFIGTLWYTDAFQYYWNGLISNARIWNRALSAAEIRRLYSEPFAMFEGVSVGKLLYTPPAETWLAGSVEAEAVTSAMFTKIRYIVGSAAAQSQGSALCKITRKVSATADCIAFLSGILTLSTRLPWFTGSLEIERPWLREVLFNCVSANAFKLGTALTEGWFWVRVSGCSALYRGADMDRIDFTNVLAVAAQNACEIQPPGYLLHTSSSTYFYVVRRFNNCGYREYTLSAAVKVSIDADGELAEPQPNNIFCSKTEQTDGNKIRLVWFYCPLEQKSKPARFKIYWDSRTGQIGYDNPIATINYQGRKYYNYQTGALEPGRYLFAIRVEDAYGVENDSLARSRIDMHTTAPDPITILSAESI